MAILVKGTDLLKRAPVILRPAMKYGMSVDMWVGDPDNTGDLQEPSEDGAYYINFTGIKHLNQPYILNEMFTGRPNIMSVSFPDLLDIKGDYCLQGTFQYCENISSFSCPNLKVITSAYYDEWGNEEHSEGYNLNYVVYGNPEVMDHKPLNIDFHSLETIDSANCFESAFVNRAGSINFDSLKEITYYGANCFLGAFSNSQLETVSFPNLEYSNADGAFAGAFTDNPIFTINFPKLTTLGGSTFSGAFSGCHNLATVEFPELSSTRAYEFSNAFTGNNSVTSVSFPKLHQAHDHDFYYAFANCYQMTSASFPVFGGIEGGSYAMANAFQNTKITTNPLQGIVTIGIGTTAHYALAYTFYGCQKLTGEFSFPSLQRVRGNYVFSHMLDGCNNITSFSIPSNITWTGGDGTFTYAFANCTKLVSVSGIPSLDLAYLYQRMLGNCPAFKTIEFTQASITKNYVFSYAFSGCTNAEFKASFPNLTSVSGQNAFEYAFNMCSQAQFKPDFPKLGEIVGNSAFFHVFTGCTNMTDDMPFPDLVSVTGLQALQYAWQDCRGITAMKFPKLYTVSTVSSTATTTKTFYRAFQSCTNLRHIYFYNLGNVIASTAKDQFNQMIYNLANCVVHFPLRMQGTMSSWSDITARCGGASTSSVVFDLITTVKIGNTTYYRHPKFDTNNALCWSTSAINTDPGVNSRRYTAGPNQPVVGDTLYTDETCTTAQGTITTVA